jgi:uncharacterized protein
MATLNERLTADMKEALRARESLRLSTIRLLLAALKNAQIEAIREQYEQYRKGGREDLESEEEAERSVIETLSAGRRDQEKQLSDEEALAVLRKQARMRHEAIEQYRKGGREDLASKEEVELAIIESYLPAAATEDQIRAVVREVIAATGASGPKDMGVVMRTTMSRLGGRADGRQVQGLVREELAALGG